MFRKNYFTFLLAIALFLVSGISAFAQNGPITGRVELTKADGTKVPAAGALVEIYRMDQKSKLPSDKTDKKGNFAFAGVPLGGKYVLAVSGAGMAPAILPNVPPGAENVVIPVTEGDGKRWTEEEVKQSLTSRTTANTNTTTQTTVSESDKKREEDIKKQNEQILAENEKIKKANEIINTSQKEGNQAFTDGVKAFEEKNYPLATTNFGVAATKFEEGYNAAPTFAAAATNFLNNLAAAYIRRAEIAYKTVTKDNRATVLESIKNDTQKAAESSDKNLEILKTATPKDEKQKLEFEARKFSALKNRQYAYYLMIRTGADRTKSKEAIIAYQEYLAAETNVVEKTKGQLTYADTLLDLQESDQAFAEYEKILATTPDNLEALAGAGFSMVDVAYKNGEDKARFQIAANYLQKFYDLAPATHERKVDAKNIIDLFKKDYKITPQKITKKS